MQVKKFEASSILEALRLVKEDLGPDAIILSSQETKKSMGGGKRFLVVAAISEQQLRKKELTQKSLGTIYEDRVKQQSARQQKVLIESVYRGIEDKFEKRKQNVTRTPYFQINDENYEEEAVQELKNPTQVAPSEVRVKKAVQDAFQSSLSSQFFENQSSAAKVPQAAEAPQATAWPEALNAMFMRLKRCGVEGGLNENLRREASRELVGQAQKKSKVDTWYARRILSDITVVNDQQSRPVEVFVGPQGAGKTTSMIKIATDYVVNVSKKVAIITTDIFKVGGIEQTRTYCRILNVPFFVIRHPSELAHKIAELQSFDKILVDTPGISLSNIEDLDFIRPIGALKGTVACQVHLVVSALTKNTDLGGLLKRFRVADFDDVIVTNIDQTSQHGILLNIQVNTDKPYHSFGISADVIDGFEYATRERVLDLIFKLTKKNGEKEHDSGI